MLQADSDEMYQCWISAMQQGIGAAIQRSISEEGSVVCSRVGNTGGSGGIGGAKDGGASRSPSGSSVGDPVEKRATAQEQVEYISDYGFLGFDIVCFCGWIPMFWRNMLS